MTIHHDRQVTRVHRVIVTGDTEAERNEEDARLRELGYRRTLWVMGSPWSMYFGRTEVVADTARGDEVAL